MRNLVDIQAIAELLGCSAKTVDRRVRKGLIPKIQPGGPGTQKKFDVEDVLRAVKQSSNGHQCANGEFIAREIKNEKLSGPLPGWKKDNKKR